MKEKQLDTKETPIEELQCCKKYIYDTGIIFECKNNCKSQIIGEDIVDLLNDLSEENEQLKQSIKEMDDAELHLKQIIINMIDDYIWQWEDEGTPVAQVLKELKEDIG